MLTLLLCASLSAEPKKVETLYLEPLIKAADRETQKAIGAAPHFIEEMKKSAEGLKGARWRAVQDNIKRYEQRIAEMKDGKRIVIPVMPYPPKLGEVGFLPTGLQLVHQGDKDALLEADWNTPRLDYDGQILKRDESAPERKALVIIDLPKTKPVKGKQSPRKPARKIGQKLDLPFIYYASAEEELGGKKGIRVEQLPYSEEQVTKLVTEWRKHKTSP